MDLAVFEKSLSSGLKETCERASWGQCWPSKMVTQKWSDGGKVLLTCDHHAPGKAVVIDRAALVPANLENTVSKLSGPGFAKLRSRLGSQFGVRCISTGESRNSAVKRIVMQTLDATPENPIVVEFDQFILEPFTGSGQFELVESDSPDGDNPVTIATHDKNFTDGITTGNWSHLRKVITADKMYSVVFAPGDAGDGSYSINARALVNQ